MGKTYTRNEIFELCRNAFQNKNTFYKQNFIKYRGSTTDTKEYYTEVIAEFLCDHISEYKNGFDCITRKKTYKTDGHDGKYNLKSNREEEIIAMQIWQQSKDEGAVGLLGKIEDYQVPLKSARKDDAGKIDLLSCDDKIMRILELKKPDNKETMLRCVLEAYTYLKTVNSDKLISDFGYNPNEIQLKASPLVFCNSMQHEEMLQSRPQLKRLMELLDSKPYYISYKTKYVVAC